MPDHAPHIIGTIDPHLPQSLLGAPLAVFDGVMTVDDTDHVIGAWVGSQHHNWGSRHTDRCAYGQVAGLDDAPDSFLEVANDASASDRCGRPS